MFVGFADLNTEKNVGLRTSIQRKFGVLDLSTAKNGFADFDTAEISNDF